MFSFLIIILVKNHNLSLALDNQTVKLLSIWSINWISPVYSHEHVEYSNASFYSTIVSMPAIQQCQLALLCSFFFHSVFLWLKFSHTFLCYFFVQLVSVSCLRFWSDLLSQTAILSCVMLCWEIFCLLCFSSCFVSLFEISAKLTATSHYSILCSISRKDLCLHPQISEVQISLAFVYNTWEWILWISLTKIW